MTCKGIGGGGDGGRMRGRVWAGDDRPATAKAGRRRLYRTRDQPRRRKSVVCEV